MDGTGSGLCSVACFVISDVETSVSGNRYFDSIILAIS